MDRNAFPDPPASAGERRLTGLVVPAPSAYEPHQRIDWIHDPASPADADENDAGETPDGACEPRHPHA